MGGCRPRSLFATTCPNTVEPVILLSAQSAASLPGDQSPVTLATIPIPAGARKLIRVSTFGNSVTAGRLANIYASWFCGGVFVNGGIDTWYESDPTQSGKSVMSYRPDPGTDFIITAASGEIDAAPVDVQYALAVEQL